jgi:hypothetical protein
MATLHIHDVFNSSGLLDSKAPGDLTVDAALDLDRDGKELLHEFEILWFHQVLSHNGQFQLLNGFPPQASVHGRVTSHIETRQVIDVAEPRIEFQVPRKVEQ